MATRCKVGRPRLRLSSIKHPFSFFLPQVHHCDVHGRVNKQKHPRDQLQCAPFHGAQQRDGTVYEDMPGVQA